MPRSLAAKAYDHYRPLIWFLGAIWIVFVVDVLTGRALTGWFGLVPRSVSGLDGVLASPFLHRDLRHLAGNSVPLVVLGALLLTLDARRFWLATAIVALAGGGLTWLVGRPGTVHVGASGVIFGWVGYLAALGIVERSLKAIVGAVIALALYGLPALTGIVPQGGAISWEGHLAGAAAGGFAGWRLARR